MKFHVAILSTISCRRQGSWKPIYTCPFSIAVGRFDWNSMWKISVKMQKRLWFFVEIGGVKSQLQGSKWNTRAVSKVFSHFEYLENRSRGLDVTWQSGETLLCIHEQSLSRGASQSAVRCRWLSLCTVWPSLGLVSRQWDAIHSAYVLCWPSHSQWLREQISLITTTPQTFIQLSCRFIFWHRTT